MEFNDLLVFNLYTVSYTRVGSYMWSLSTPQATMEAPHPRSGLPFDQNTELEGAETSTDAFEIPSRNAVIWTQYWDDCDADANC
jgi:hypothetical protein